MTRCSIDDVPTPALVIDRVAVDRNITRVADYARSHGLKVRPHTKTHKSLRMAALQLAAGASGLSVAKAGEARVMAGGCDDILVAYPALDPARTAVLAQLARGRTVRVAVDSALAVDALARAAAAGSATLGVLVDLDVGFHRTGVQTPQAALVLAQRVATSPGLRLDGLFIYPGHISSPREEHGIAFAPVQHLLSETLSLWRAQGLEAGIVSGGSTPTALTSHLLRGLTEIRPGTYIYNDRTMLAGGWCSLDDCAARFICTVVSDAVPGKVVLDAGTKTLTSDRFPRDPAGGGHGLLVQYPRAVVVRLSEEHGEVDITSCDRPPRLGERVELVPNHVCPCINLQDSVWLKEPDGSLEPLPIDARGLLS